MGLEAAGWRVVYANDWSGERAQMYRGFFGEDEPYEVKDIFAVTSMEHPPGHPRHLFLPLYRFVVSGEA